MGRMIEEPANETSSSSSFNALLFTTMCMIGLPVEVQVKDDSVYSGIFHTASVEGKYGVVLKKASMVRKGKGNANLSVGAVIDTLVVLSGDLVQVIVKGVLLPGDGIVGNIYSDDAETVAGFVKPPSFHSEQENESKALKFGKPTSKRFSVEDTTQIGLNRRMNENEDNNTVSLANKNFRNSCFLTKGEKKLDMREVAAKPMENILEVEYGKNDSLNRAKVEETSSVPLVSNSFDEGQDGKGNPQGEEDECSTPKDDNMVHGVPCSSSSTAACIPKQKYLNGTALEISSKIIPNGAACASLGSPPVIPKGPDHEMPTSTYFQPSDVLASNVSSSTSVKDIFTTPCLSPLASPIELAPSNNSAHNTNSKEFKLNPAAKTFSPSFAYPRPTPPAVTAIASMSYTPSSSPILPIGTAQPGIEISPFAPRTSVPVKFVQYSNLVVGNSAGGTQHGSLNSLPIAGHVGSRQQPMRYSSQYQSGSAYVHPNSQTVMVGRLGQVVYVHPIPHAGIQGAATLCQGPERPILAPHQAHLPKHQGPAAQSMQMCMTPPFIAGGQQSFAVPSHTPFTQPFPAIRPISVPGVSSVFDSKFH